MTECVFHFSSYGLSLYSFLQAAHLTLGPRVKLLQSLGTVFTKLPNLNSSSIRQDHTNLPFHTVMSGQPSHIFCHPPSKMSIGWIIITDCRWSFFSNLHGLFKIPLK